MSRPSCEINYVPTKYGKKISVKCSHADHRHTITNVGPCVLVSYEKPRWYLNLLTAYKAAWIAVSIGRILLP